MEGFDPHVTETRNATENMSLNALEVLSVLSIQR